MNAVPSMSMLMEVDAAGGMVGPDQLLLAYCAPDASLT